MRRAALVLQASRRPPTPLALRRLSSVTRPSSQRNVEVDVCIVGGGIVGSCVAAALKRAPRTRHLRVALVDSCWPTRLTGSSAPAAQPEQQRALPSESAVARDRRVYAISPASRQLLQAVGAWQLLPADCAHNYDSMQVWQAVGAGVLQLKAGDAGLESLGCIVGHAALQSALKQCVLDTDVTCIGSDARFLSSLPPAAAAAAGHVLSAGDFSVSCALLVGADGAASRVRAHSGIASASMSYSSHAVVATLQVFQLCVSHACTQPSAAAVWKQQHCASALPVNGTDSNAAAGCRLGLSRVDSADAPGPTDGGRCAALAPAPAMTAPPQVSLPTDEFVTSINEAFRANHAGAAVLPPLVTGIEGKAASVPLQLMQACRMQDNSVVLVGDSAHAVHPLAGQGLNLGLHDALSLVAHMSRAAAAGGAADDFLALQAYERERLPINAAWGAAIDFIGRTFGVQSPAIAFPRGLALSLINAAMPLKQQIISAASGEGGQHLQNLEELK